MSWRGVIIHHSAGHADKPLWKLDQEHRGRGFSEVGYHFYIPADGTVWLGRSTLLVGAHCHAGGRNRTHLGICLAGDFETHEPTKAQMDTLLNVVVEQIARYWFSSADIQGHTEVPGARTACPGIRLLERLPWLRRQADLLLPWCML